jgi:hypothetical protein
MKKLNKKKSLLGIISIIVAGVACIIPGGALIATIIGTPLIIFSWRRPILALLSGLINIINLIFLSPTMWLAMGFAEIDNSGGAISLGKTYVMVQIIAIFIMGIVTFITWLSTKKI